MFAHTSLVARRLLCVAVLPLSAVWAQSSKPKAPSGVEAIAGQATKVLQKAVEDGSLQRAGQQAKGLIQQAGSAPAGMLRQLGGSGVLDAVRGKTEPAQGGAAQKAGASAASAAAVSPLPPWNQAAGAQGTPVGVIEADQSDFDLNRSVFIYRGNVRARHPEFYIECEELEVEMIRETPTASKAAAKEATKADKKAVNQKTDSNKSRAAAKDSSGQAPPIRRAVARGPMVVIEKRSADGDLQQGRCRLLEYDGKTGEITLRDYPQVQKGNVLHVATTADTMMIFDRAGSLRTQGRPRTVILNENSQPER
jgi:lipopolysaccharide export system protein LptA